ncbi:GNAT family N-acetyltransferase [Streptomyces sp. I6]|nr:GNAT family N-acetyltransferase [Streptomyces sp. I6]
MIEAWAAGEGWELGIAGMLAHAVSAPQGLLVGRLDGVAAASVFANRYGDDYGFIGLYITRADVRGRGLGSRMWRAAQSRLEGRLIGLDAVPAWQDLYIARGLRSHWRNIHFCGVPRQQDTVSAPLELVDAATLPFEVVTAYDRRFFPAPRDAFLAAWTRMPGVKAITALLEGLVVGFGVSRPSRQTRSRVGPLYADSPEAAAAVLRGLAAAAPGRAVVIDVPETNAPALATIAGLGLRPDAYTVRMYNGAAPEVEFSGIYGVTSLEAG